MGVTKEPQALNVTLPVIMVPMVTIVKTNVASTVEFQRDVTGLQGGVRESAKWDGKDRLVILNATEVNLGKIAQMIAVTVCTKNNATT